MSDNGDRRKNYALRRRIDKLLGRVHEARAQIVEKGLDAVHEDPDRRERGGDDREAPTDAGPADARA